MRGLLQAAAIAVATLLLLECGLQVAARVAVPSRAGRADGDAAVRILCVGDSHTFGSGVDEAESYPAQLEERLRALYRPLWAEVYNLGMPGANTAYVARRLEAQVIELRPQVVILWVGSNNLWNTAEMQGSREGSSLRTWLLRSRLFRAVAAARYAREGRRHVDRVRSGPARREDLVYEVGQEELARGEARRTIAADLERIIATSRALDVAVLMIDYPWVASAYANAAIRETGTSLGVGVIDTPELWRTLSERHSQQELAVSGIGPHPSGLLYGYVVEALLPPLVEILSERGLPPRTRSR